MTGDASPRAHGQGRWARRLRIMGFIVAFCGGWLVGHTSADPPAPVPPTLVAAEARAPATPPARPSAPRWLQALRARSRTTP
jgi:hypothetical protein